MATEVLRRGLYFGQALLCPAYLGSDQSTKAHSRKVEIALESRGWLGEKGHQVKLTVHFWVKGKNIKKDPLLTKRKTVFVHLEEKQVRRKNLTGLKVAHLFPVCFFYVFALYIKTLGGGQDIAHRENSSLSAVKSERRKLMHWLIPHGLYVFLTALAEQQKLMT